MESGMKIAVDVDGVLAEQVKPVIKRLNTEYTDEIENEIGRLMKKEDIKSWEEPIPGTDTDIKIEIETAHKDPNYISEMPTIGNAREVISELHSEGHTIYVVTSRVNVSDEHTISWLEERSIPFDEFINTSKMSKAEVDAHVLIDDYPKNLMDFAETNRPGILFLQPWNKDHTSIENDLIYTATDWDDIYDIISKISDHDTTEGEPERSR